jgi:hypothetical protein
VGGAVGALLPRDHVLFEGAAAGLARAAMSPLLPGGGAGLSRSGLDSGGASQAQRSKILRPPARTCSKGGGDEVCS